MPIDVKRVDESENEELESRNISLVKEELKKLKVSFASKIFFELKIWKDFAGKRNYF